LKSLINSQKLQSLASTEIARTIDDEGEARTNGHMPDETISDISSQNK